MTKQLLQQALAQQEQPAQEPVLGMTVTALAGEIIEALLADEKDGGYDLTAGLFGANFSTLVRRWARAEGAAPPTQPALSNDEVRAVAEQVAEEMWPGSGYVGWTQEDADFYGKFTRAIEAHCRGGANHG